MVGTKFGQFWKVLDFQAPRFIIGNMEMQCVEFP